MSDANIWRMLCWECASVVNEENPGKEIDGKPVHEKCEEAHVHRKLNPPKVEDEASRIPY